MTVSDFDELFVEEIPDYTDVEGLPTDGYTVIRVVTGPLSVPVLRKRIIDRIECLDALLEKEKAGGQPAGLAVDDYSTMNPSSGIFGAALLESMDALIREGAEAYFVDEGWGSEIKMDGVSFQPGLAEGPDGPETHLTLFADKARVRAIVESGKLDTNKLDIKITRPVGDIPWITEDRIEEIFRANVGRLLMEAAIEPIRRSADERRSAEERL
ncbi:hypothetical protein ACLRGI_22495 [Paenarthrobacter nitroguajacolicus]|uniref:hypothetical protein n=1 Tax=Paenarthrobacter nitroguajacolicus TaxID=211146 RepID=UPI003AEAFE78